MFAFLTLRKPRKELRETVLAAKRRLISDDDILSDAKKEELRGIVSGAAAVNRSDRKAMEEFIRSASAKLERLSDVHGNKRKLRNILDILAVAFAVAFGIRALYLQPFKIPTSSMQPTLFGIHYVDRKGFAEHNSPAANLLKIPYLAVRPAEMSRRTHVERQCNVRKLIQFRTMQGAENRKAVPVHRAPQNFRDSRPARGIATFAQPALSSPTGAGRPSASNASTDAGAAARSR